MKKTMNMFGLLLLVLSFAAAGGAGAVFAQADDERKTEAFSKIAKLANNKKPEDQEKAYQLGKDFLAKYGQNAGDEQVKKIRDFVVKYRTSDFNKKLDELKTAEAFALGKEMLAQEPENTYVVMNLAYGGYEAFNKKQDKTFNGETLAYAKQALSLLEAGKKPTSFEPFKSEAEATAVMYYVIGTLSIESDPALAAQNFYKSLQFESSLKNNSYPYYAIAFGYEKAYENLAVQYQKKELAKAPESELKALQDKLDKILDRMLDAYARALKVAETDNNPGKDGWRQRFAQVYKHRHQSETGMNEFLNSVMTKPFPEPSTL